MTFETPLILALAPLLGALLAGLAVLARRRRLAAAGAWSGSLLARARQRARLTPWVRRRDVAEATR